MGAPVGTSTFTYVYTALFTGFVVTRCVSDKASEAPQLPPDQILSCNCHVVSVDHMPVLISLAQMKIVSFTAVAAR